MFRGAPITGFWSDEASDWTQKYFYFRHGDHDEPLWMGLDPAWPMALDPPALRSISASYGGRMHGKSALTEEKLRRAIEVMKRIEREEDGRWTDWNRHLAHRFQQLAIGPALRTIAAAFVPPPLEAVRSDRLSRRRERADG